MADKTSIEWTDATWNPIRARNKETGGIGHFCVHASEGCRNCYAERLQPRFQNPIRFAAQDRDKVEIYLDETVLIQPLRWRRARRIFPCSMTDLFGEWVTDDMLDRIFAVMALADWHTYQPLTKRAKRMRDYFADKDRPIWVTEQMMAINPAYSGHNLCACDGSDGDGPWPLPNVWLGVSVEDQKTADERIPLLLETPAAKRVISAEPLLGPVDFNQYLYPGIDGPLLSQLHQVIAGGESGPDARPMHPLWVRSLRDQCQDAETAFFFKQWGEWAPAPWIVNMSSAEFYGLPDNSVHRFDIGCGENIWMRRVGKKAAGRLLDGRTWDEFPACLSGCYR